MHSFDDSIDYAGDRQKGFIYDQNEGDLRYFDGDKNREVFNRLELEGIIRIFQRLDYEEENSHEIDPQIKEDLDEYYRHNHK